MSNDTPSLSEQRSPLWLRGGCWLLVGLMIWVHFRLEAARLPTIHQAGQWYLADPDDYMRIDRVRRILEGRAVVVRAIQDMNPPNGVTLHWTAPMDYLLATAAWISGRGDAMTGLISATVWTPVALGAVALIAMVSLVRRAAGWGPALVAGWMLALSRSFHMVYKLGHADHHALLDLFMLLAVLSWFPRRGTPDAPTEPTHGGATLSGLCMGMAWWVSAQAIVAWAAILAGVMLAAFHAPPDRRAVWMDLRRRFSLALMAVMLPAVLIENWPRVWTPMLDSISALHLGLAWLGFCLPYFRTPPLQRPASAWTIFLASAGAMTVWTIFTLPTMNAIFTRPEFYWWSTVVTELQPLYLTAGSDWSIGPFLNYLGHVPLVLPVATWFFLTDRGLSGATRATLTLLAAGMVVLAFLQLRWLYHVHLGLIPVCVIGLHAMLRRILQLGTVGAEAGRLSLLAIILCVATWRSTEQLFAMRAAVRPLPFVQRAVHAAQAIRNLQATDKPTLGPFILCAPEEGPLLLYETRRPVVAGPYHRALDGYLDVCRFFAETDARQARAQLERLRVGYIVVPSDGPLALRVMERATFGQMRSFDPPQRKIEDGELFESVTPLPNLERTMVYHLEHGTPPVELGVEPVAKLQRSLSGETEVVGFIYAVRPRG